MRRYHIRAGATTTAGGVRRQGGTKVATGDHIDLWNGSKLTPNAVNNVRRLGLNSVQWLPWPLDDLNFSDLGNSTKILFWEVK